MLVSVIIPCYNVEKYIVECVESVLKQKHSEIEIICIDNNSSDSTLSLLRGLKEIYKDKIIIGKELRQGAPAARNKGLELAHGEYLQFLDADDILLPDKITVQLNLLLDRPDYGFVAGAYSILTVKNEKIDLHFPHNDIFKLLFTTQLGITSANLFRMDALKSVGLWDVSLKSSQEYDLMFRILADGKKAILCDKNHTLIRERESGQISQADPVAKWKRYLNLRLSMIDYLSRNKKEYFTEEQNYYWQQLFSTLRTLAKYDLSAANKIFKDNFDNGFTPESNKKISLYKISFKLFGFFITEKIYKFVSLLSDARE